MRKNDTFRKKRNQTIFFSFLSNNPVSSPVNKGEGGDTHDTSRRDQDESRHRLRAEGQGDSKR